MRQTSNLVVWELVDIVRTVAIGYAESGSFATISNIPHVRKEWRSAASDNSMAS